MAFVFATLSMSFGAFVTRLPEIKEKLDLSEAALGSTLFFIPLGAVALLPFYSKIIARFGERRTTSLAVTALLLVMILPGLVTSNIELRIVFFLMGMAMGLTDVSVNAETAVIEKQHSRVIMSSCHGYFSLGGMIGALVASLFIGMSIDLVLQMVLVAIVLFLIMLPQFRYMINSSNTKNEESKTFKLPSAKLLVFAIIGFCIMMSEGGITDWSTIFLKDDMSLSAEYAGFGFAGFSLLMAIGRFQGDRLRLKYGGRKLVLAGCMIATVGLALVVVGSPVLAIVGFSLAGLGYSVIVPILFSTAAQQEGVLPSQGIASVASAGYIGMLTGPVAIGYIGEALGLVHGFTFLLGLTILGLILVISFFR